MFTITKPNPDDLPILTEIARKTLWESHGHSAAAEDMQTYLDNKVTQEALRAELLDERNCFYWINSACGKKNKLCQRFFCKI